VPALPHDIDLDSGARAALTIDQPTDQLLDLWRSPDTFRRIMADFATIKTIDQDTADWQVDGPLGRQYRWQTRSSVNAPGQVGWVSLDGADIPNMGELRFQPAPGDRGTEVSLEVRFDPPGGAVGEGIAKLFHLVPREIVLKALYNFRALALTGEIPTTAPQPAARNGGVDR
jgi:uncharacterized membrane protein